MEGEKKSFTASATKIKRERDDGDHIEGPLRTHFKPDPDSLPQIPSGNAEIPTGPTLVSPNVTPDFHAVGQNVESEGQDIGINLATQGLLQERTRLGVNTPESGPVHETPILDVPVDVYIKPDPDGPVIELPEWTSEVSDDTSEMPETSSAANKVDGRGECSGIGLNFSEFTANFISGENSASGSSESYKKGKVLDQEYMETSSQSADNSHQSSACQEKSTSASAAAAASEISFANSEVGKGTMSSTENPPIKAEGGVSSIKVEKAYGSDCYDSKGRPLVTNVFEWDKPLPKVEPATSRMKPEYAPISPKVAHYRLHSHAEEKEYAKDRPTMPIKIHKEDSENEEESEFDFPVDNKRQRYFKKIGALRDYDFGIYNCPETSVLAVHQYKQQIIDAVIKNNVVVVQGFTGCGKTTQIPQYILDHCIKERSSCNIVVTQPRRVATMTVARRVCFERGWEIGTVVGYQVGMEKQSDHRKTMVTYMTTGVLLQKLIHSKSLKRFSHIIIDEVHERDLESDFLLLIIKKILMEDKEGREKHVKIILMSATINASKFSKYFSFQRGDNHVEEAPIINIPLTQAKYEVEEIFLEDVLVESDINELEFNSEKALLHSDIYDAAVKIIADLDEIENEKKFSETMDPRVKSEHYKYVKPVEKRGSVLVFLPGFAEIDALSKRLMQETRKYMTSGGDTNLFKWDIYPLHSSITSEDQSKVFLEPKHKFRKIILATNIAESSITVPDVVYVIDFCLTKSLSMDPRTNFSCLRMVWASISQCIQRKGRTGRVANGKVYRLVPKEFYLKSLEKETIPDMLRAGLEDVVVRVKSFNMGSPKEVLSLAIDAPPLSGIERAVVNLKEVGGLTLYVAQNEINTTYDTCDGDLTFMGKVMSQLPISHQCTRLIMLGHAFGVLKESIVVAAGLSVKSPFNSHFRRQRELYSYERKLEWAQKSYSDCFTILHLFRHWSAEFGSSGGGRENDKAEKRFGENHCVQISVLREIRSVVEEIETRLRNLNIVATPCSIIGNNSENDHYLTKEQGILLKVAIAGAFYPNYFHRHRPDKTYEREKSKEVNGYASNIAEQLAKTMHLPKVNFEGQKVLVTFDNAGEKLGPISLSVYKAVKRRQIREKFELRVLPKHNERAYLGEQKERIQHEDNRANFDRCPAQVELPPIRITEFFAIVQHVESPSSFWVIYSGHEQKHAEMQRILNTKETGGPLRNNQVRVGAFCLAVYEGEFYRARIRTILPGDKVLVFFVDYGNTSEVKRKDCHNFGLWCGPHDPEGNFRSKPCLAVECRLAGIKASVVCGSVWHPTAIQHFQEYVQNPDRYIKYKIYGVVKSVIIGTLFGIGKEENLATYDGLNVNELLVNHGYADWVKENAACEFNHKAREGYHLMRQDKLRIETHNAEQAEPMEDIDYIPSPRNGSIRVELKGPWSPLELEFFSLCHSSSSKQVKIDDASVNSVALDQEPMAPTSRLVVASSVNIQDKSGRVVARDTTIMPAMPGMMALMGMIFAPKIEMRLNKHGNRYSGVLCGLGVDPEYNAAVYQDHDMEIIFDTVIDDDDIGHINCIRNYMNLILREEHKGDLTTIHTKLIVEIMGLLKRRRQRLEEETWPDEMYAWNKVPPNDFRSERGWFEQESLDIFMPHSSVVLRDVAAPNVIWEFAV